MTSPLRCAHLIRHGCLDEGRRNGLRSAEREKLTRLRRQVRPATTSCLGLIFYASEQGPSQETRSKTARTPTIGPSARR